MNENSVLSLEQVKSLQEGLSPRPWFNHKFHGLTDGRGAAILDGGEFIFDADEKAFLAIPALLNTIEHLYRELAEAKKDSDEYQAVIGYDLDDESAMWGFGETAQAALDEAIQMLREECPDLLENSVTCEATIYKNPFSIHNEDGTLEIKAWHNRAICEVEFKPSEQPALKDIQWDLTPR